MCVFAQFGGSSICDRKKEEIGGKNTFTSSTAPKIITHNFHSKNIRDHGNKHLNTHTHTCSILPFLSPSVFPVTALSVTAARFDWCQHRWEKNADWKVSVALSSSGSSASAAAVWQSSDTGRPFRRQVGGGDYHRADLCQHHHHHRHRRSLGAVRQICRSSSSHNSTAVYLSLLILSKHAQTEVEKEEKEEESGKRWKRNEQQNDCSKSQKLFWFVLYKTGRWVMSVRRLSCRTCRRRRRLCRLWPVHTFLQTRTMSPLSQ